MADKDYSFEERKLKGRESQTELIRDVFDPELRIVDRINDFSGGVNFRDYTLVEDNQAIELQNGYPGDIFVGREGYTKYNSTALTGVTGIENIVRFYLGKTSQHLIVAGTRTANKTGIDAYTVLCLHCNGSDGGTTFVDSSRTPHSPSAVGNCQLDTTQKKFGSTSGLFDGSGDYISIADSTDWDFGTSPLTLDFWVRFNELPASMGDKMYIFSQYEGAADYWNFCIENVGGVPNEYKWSFRSSYNVPPAQTVVVDSDDITVNADTWYHVALIRGWGGNANDWVITVNGTSAMGVGGPTTQTSNTGVSAAALEIGTTQSGSSCFNGWLDEIRISSGIARETATFTPWTWEYEDGDEVNDRLFFGDDDLGTFTEVSGGTVLTGGQKYQFSVYKDDLFIASENQDLQYSDDGISKIDCGGTLPANAGHLLTVHEERLFNAGSASALNTLYYSASGVHSGDPSSDMDFDGGGSININQGDGDYIVGLISFYKVLWVFKRNYVVQILGDSRFNFTPHYPPVNKGAVGYKAICKGDSVIYFVSRTGVHSIDAAGTLETISHNIDPIFRKATGTEWDVNKNHMDKTVLFMHDGYLWMSYTSGSSTVPNSVVIYDPLRKAWYPQKGMDINCAIIQSGYSDTYQLRTGATSAGTVWIMNSGYSDNTAAIEFVYKTKYKDQKMPERHKEYTEMIADVDCGKADTITVHIDIDETVTQQTSVVTTQVGKAWGSFNWGDAYWSGRTNIPDPVPLEQSMRGLRIAARFSYSSDDARLKIRSCTFIASPEMLRR